jgi:hypothetical protein
MVKAMGVSVAFALAVLLAVPNASPAAAKKKSTPISESCLGGGCLGVEANPNRTRQPDTTSYKRTKTKKASKQ